jgi:mycothiol system anti-sigma-R factor
MSVRDENPPSGASGAAADSTVPSDELCRQVVADVWLFLDNEMDEGRRQVVQQHIANCEPCLDHTDLSDRLKALVHRTCGGDAAPPELKAAVAALLRP